MTNEEEFSVHKIKQLADWIKAKYEDDDYIKDSCDLIIAYANDLPSQIQENLEKYGDDDW